MHVKELQLIVGRARFAKAAELARQTAEDTGVQMPPDNPLLWTLPEEIGSHLLTNHTSWSPRITSLFEVYREIPCYGLLNFLGENYLDFDPEHREAHWRGCLELLDTGEPRFARPVEYYLWCDFFETGDLSEEAWDAMVTPHTPENALKSLLVISGPVPFDLKLPLYKCLLPEVQWHPFIFLSLLHSQFEEHGQLDPQPAKAIAQQLTLPASTPNWNDLQRSLGIRPGLKVL